MNAYKVNYSGSWLGGRAIVLANTADEAKELVSKDSSTSYFDDVTVELIASDLTNSIVLYNDDGEY